MSSLSQDENIEPDNLDSNASGLRKKNIISYEIMHMDQAVARISLNGAAEIFAEKFMPYDLYLEEDPGNDLDIMLNNHENFIHWCASRVLSLDRKYAKEILNSIGAVQAVTDRDRAQISLSYHCVSLTDVFWVKRHDEEAAFRELNLYDQTLNAAAAELSLEGHPMNVTIEELAPDLSTGGCFPKAWIREEHGFKLLKDGSEESVKRELLASEICQCFAIPQVVYRAYNYDGRLVTESDIITSKERSIVSKRTFDIYAANHGLNTLDVCKELDPIIFYGMNILDYLTGNTDRHPENWGFLVDNETNQYISLYPLMDFNQCFLSFDDLDGAACLPLLPEKKTQREAALDAVRHIGLPQRKEMDLNRFGEMKKEAAVFQQRLAVLRSAGNV